MNRPKLQPGFYFVLAVSVLLIPVRWCFAWLFAGFIHELSHIAMLQLCGCRILSITIGPAGAVIESDCGSQWAKIFCTLAGPVGGLLLLLFSRIMPRVAICGLIQSCYNLLPFAHLDGGRILEYLTCIVLPRQRAERFLICFQSVLVSVVIALALYGCFFLHMGWMPLLLVGILLLKNKKSLANTGIRQYNRKDKIIRGYRYDGTNPTNFTNGSEAGTVYRRGI